MAKRTAPTSSTTGPAFPPLGLVVGPGAPAANSLHHASHSYSNPHNAASSPATEPTHTANGLPPAPNKFDVSQAQQCRLQDAYWSDEEEDMDCPLCLEEIDLSDANFKPCPCGYQICRFCWHHIKQNLNGRCPACRRKYSDQTVEFKPMTAEEIKRLTQAKKQKEREKKELESMNRKHLANMRVVQKNLVYVVGLSSKLAKEELIPTLRSNEYFGQYGRISKILISKRNTASKLVMGTSETALGVYVTYHRKEDAAKAIVAIDGSKGSDGRIVRASYGTTKYCTTYLRNLPCTNPGCTYLHEPGEEADSFTKEDLSTLRHAAKDAEHKIKPASLGITQPPKRSDFLSAADAESSALPKTASWASGKPVSAAGSPAPIAVGSPFRDSDMPPLSASSASALARKVSSQKPSTPKAQKQLSSNSKSKLVLATGRPDSPALLATDSPGQSQPSSPVPSRAVATPSTATDFGSIAPAASATPRKDSATAKASTTDSALPPPPGLVKPSSPPGLARSASTTDSRPATPHTDSDHPRSNYQPSSSAQAVLDDMLQRREAQPEIVKPSPFPDFDDALSSFKDGDFSFNLPANQQLANNDGPSELTSAFTTFSPFGPPPGVLAAHASLVTAGTPPPGIVRAPNRSSTASPAPLTYSGSFDPFAPGAGETIKEDGSSFAADNAYPTSFTIADQTRTILGQNHLAGGDMGGLTHDDSLETGHDASKRASRFDFAKRKESDSFISASPLRTELMQGMRESDSFGAGKDVTSMLGSVFDQDNLSNRLNGLGDGGASAAAFGLHSRETGGFPGMGLSRPPPGIGGPGFGSRFGTNTPPPGISAPASRQQQALLASLHQMGGSNLGSASASHQQQQQQQQTSQLSNGSGGGGFLADLQQQAAQRAQQQAQFASGRELSEAGRPNGNGNSNPSDPLLAHLLAGRRANYGGQSGGSDMPFGDPAIMSMNRAQLQAAQQQQQQFGGNRYGASMGGFGGVSSFSPFDQMSNANAGFGSASQYGDHQQRFAQQQQQQQGQSQASPYPNMS
ncbi:transcriptional repressor [Pseudozyma hubeiensis SY62]|uniref:Transcriptional repressor n=1 Tax=Pseudozyma hubeiensis (strain SY62) TaxID=1305764 RepID=R9NXP3_PSEHS|nr:transcriptional repressor [Pseudozyma hubeiensis SY62]GAC93503.1 transcriptional repressor [Pseudozyma hubeiensis SY62]